MRLRERYPQWAASTAVAGSSAGAIIGAGACSGLDRAEMASVITNVASEIGNPVLSLLPFSGVDLSGLGAEQLARVLPPDAHQRCSGRLFVGISTFPVGSTWPPRFRFVSNFSSRDHLIECLRISAFLPGITGPMARVPTLDDGSTAIDGGFVRNWPRLPRGKQASGEDGYRTLLVSAFAGPDFHVAPEVAPPPKSGGVGAPPLPSLPSFPFFGGVRLTAHLGLLRQLPDVVLPPDDAKMESMIAEGAAAVDRFCERASQPGERDDGQSESKELLKLLRAADGKASNGCGRGFEEGV